MVELKKVSIKKVFESVFGIPLSERGFVLCKKNGIYMRLVDDEVLKFVLLTNDRADTRDKKAFYIQAGMISLYTERLEKLTFLQQGLRAPDLAKVLGYPYRHRYEYDPYDRNDAEKQMKAALEEACSIFFPIMDSVKGLSDYVDYCKMYNVSRLYFSTRFSGDSLALILLEDHDDFTGVLQGIKKQYERNGHIDAFEIKQERLKECFLGFGAGERDKVYADSELYKAALEEAKRRREAYLQQLKEWKVID